MSKEKEKKDQAAKDAMKKNKGTGKKEAEELSDDELDNVAGGAKKVKY